MLRTLTLLTLLSAPIAAQSSALAERVARLDDGTAELRFAARPGVCGDGAGTIGIGRSMQIMNDGNTYGRGGWKRACEPGPVRVRLTVRGGEVMSLRTMVGEPRSDAAAAPGRAADHDLGTVSGAEAARYLMALAAQLPGKAAERAVLPAVLADSATTWPQLLRLARDESRPRAVRSSAAHWLGRQASAAASGSDDPLGVDLDDAEDDSDEASVRTHAVFALSQLPRNEGVPPLLTVARTNRDARVRRAALFWLGQSLDPRALDLFEEVLAKRR